jgi:transcriptional regulator with XRE-family HTH domain
MFAIVLLFAMQLVNGLLSTKYSQCAILGLHPPGRALCSRSTMMNPVGERIKARRAELDWTQEQLAREAGLSKGFISDLEAGKRSVGADSLLDIATALGVSMDHLMKGRVSHSQTGEINIPVALSQLARSLNLSFGQTLLLLDLQRQIIAHRSRSKSDDLEKVDWKRFYETVKDYIK